MHLPILFSEPAGARLPAPNPSAILFIAVLWLTFACGLPLYQLHEARRQAHQDLQYILAADTPDKANVVAVFDRSNQRLDAAASGPCLILAFTIIFLVHQLLKLKRQCNALAHGLSASNSRGAGLDEASEN